MWPFGKKKVTPTSPPVVEAPPPPQAVAPDNGQKREDFKRQAVKEAISALGLIKPEAEDTMLSFLRDEMDIHPRQTVTGYRKGEQLSKDEKRALGLRSNAFLSRRAFDELTEDGLEEPLKAHETVLLRATFSLNRYRTLESLKAADVKSMKEFQGIKYDVLEMRCPVCGPLDGKVIQIEEASILPLKGCTCDTANFGYRAHMDFLAGWNDEH